MNDIRKCCFGARAAHKLPPRILITAEKRQGWHPSHTQRPIGRPDLCCVMEVCQKLCFKSIIFIYFFNFKFYCYSITVVCLFSHPSTPPQPKPPPSPTSTLPPDFVHVSFIGVPVIPSTHCPIPTPACPLLDCS